MRTMRSIKIIQPPKSIHAKLDQSLCWCDAGVAGGRTDQERERVHLVACAQAAVKEKKEFLLSITM